MTKRKTKLNLPTTKPNPVTALAVSVFLAERACRVNRIERDSATIIARLADTTFRLWVEGKISLPNISVDDITKYAEAGESEAAPI